jgi:cbb3-type cytochrome oxidase subunit 1
MYSKIPPPDPMRKTHVLGFYGGRVFYFFPYRAKRPNFRLPAVGFWSLAFPFFARAGSLPPAGTRAPIYTGTCLCGGT